MSMSAEPQYEASPAKTNALAKSGRKCVVIVGGGFAGLQAAKALTHLPVDVIIVDRKNHHTFQPLLYQVATGALSPANIAQSIRSIVANDKNTKVILSEVVAIDTAGKQLVLVDESRLRYDYLILATGATHSYFGHDEWAKFAPGLKSIEDATEIRRRILLAFEMAERQVLETGQNQALNFVVIGGGPTGVELAGALSEMCRVYLKNDFRMIDTTKAKVLLVEAMPKILGPYSPELTEQAVDQLKQLGVEVMTDTKVLSVSADYIDTNKGKIETAVVLWAAGVQASPLGKLLQVPVDRRGCVIVDQYMNPPDHPEIFICGDLAHFEENGKQLPGVAQTAMQMGVHAASLIECDIKQKTRTPFHYWDKGDLCTIGRGRAVANIKWPLAFRSSGLFAWFIWITIHILFISGLRNRVSVFMEWLWIFMTNRRGALLITNREEGKVLLDESSLTEI
jgi:NADH:ubiquinone reductase (H+-translocating)